MYSHAMTSAFDLSNTIYEFDSASAASAAQERAKEENFDLLLGDGDFERELTYLEGSSNPDKERELTALMESLGGRKKR